MTSLRCYLEHALRDAGRVELRVFGDRIRSGLFDNCNLLEAAIFEGERTGLTQYLTLNAPKLRPATNALDGWALTDSDMGHIVRLPFDLDSVRGKGENSTSAEVKAAARVRDQFVAAMRLAGFPMPLLGMSGNGAHALYRCRLPASDDGLQEALTAIYTVMKADYSTENVIFDPTVRNPSRIWRIYGTTNRKNPEAECRPQRIATCRIPPRWEIVDPRALYRLADTCARRNVRREPSREEYVQHAGAISGSGDYSTLDAAAWFRAHGLYKRVLPGGKHAVVCPWREEHSDPLAGLAPHGTDTVLFEQAGRWPAFHCSHAHCDGRGIRDVMALWGDADRFCRRDYHRRPK